MKFNVQTYSENILHGYNAWASSRLPIYLKQTGDVSLQQPPELYLMNRRHARHKSRHNNINPISQITPLTSILALPSQIGCEAIPAIQILNDLEHPRLLLIGDPGMGKSTLMWSLLTSAKVML